MKKIPTVNYLKVVLLFVITIFAVLVLANNYKQKLQYERANKDIMMFLSNVKYDELSNYLVENHDGFIYMASSSDTSLEKFEEELKQYILEEELDKYFVYLDSSDYSSDMYEQIKNSFFSKELFNQVTSYSQPNVFVVKDGEIIALLYPTKSNILLEDVKNLVNIYGVIE